jgi:hypothetical protein
MRRVFDRRFDTAVGVNAADESLQPVLSKHIGVRQARKSLPVNNARRTDRPPSLAEAIGQQLFIAALSSNAQRG